MPDQILLWSGGGKGQVIVSEESIMEREAARKGGNPSFRSRRGTRSSRGSFQSSRKSISQSQLGIGPGQQLSQKQLDASTRGMADPAVSHLTPFQAVPSCLHSHLARHALEIDSKAAPPSHLLIILLNPLLGASSWPDVPKSSSICVAHPLL